jgi:hypothetical protein
MLARGGSAAAQATATATLPPGWHAYRDPDGYFILAPPEGWQVRRGVSYGGMQGGLSGSAGIQDVRTIFVPPGADPTSMAPDLGVRVTFEIITSATGTFKHDVLCGIYRDANTTLAGYPARRNPPSSIHNWSLAASATWYQVDYSLPGDYSSIQHPVPPTPVPAATRTAAEAQALAILATFRPIPATPPQC